MVFALPQRPLLLLLVKLLLGLVMLVVVLLIVLIVLVVLVFVAIFVTIKCMTLVEFWWLSVLPFSLLFAAVDRYCNLCLSNVGMVGVLRLRIINFCC